MATITRFDKFTPRDYNMEWFVPQLAMPNMQAWDEMLSTQQQKYNAAVALSEKMPKNLDTPYDRELYTSYKQASLSAVDEISKAYQEQGVTAGNRTFRDISRNLLREWQPGGRAYALEDRYTAFQKGLEEIQKSYEKDPRGINKAFATYNLKKQLESPINYDPQTGRYQRISTPELYQDPNIQKLILDAVKEIGESGTTAIIKKDPFWFEKIKKMGKPEDQLAAVAQAVYEQYPQQLAIESWHRGFNANPDAVKSGYENSIDRRIQQKESILKTAKGMKPEEIKRLQNEMIQLGYDVKADGVWGPKSEKAFKEYLKEEKTRAEEMKNNFNMDNYMRQQVEQGYIDYARQFRTEKIDRDLIYNKQADLYARLRAQRSNTESIINAMQSIVAPPVGKELSTPDIGRTINDFQKSRENAQLTVDNAKANLKSLMKGSIGQLPGGSDPNRLLEYVNFFARAGRDPEKFKQFIRESNLPEFKYMSDDAINQIYGTILNNGDAIMPALKTYEDAVSTQNLMETTDKSLTETYIKTTGKKEFDRLSSQYKKPGETDEDFMRAILNKDPRFNKYTADVKTGSAADQFLAGRMRDIKRNPERYQNNINTYSITSTKDSKAMGELSELVQNDLKNGDFTGYVSSGKQGLYWKNPLNNKDVSPSSNVENIKVELNSGFGNGVSYKITGAYKKDGKDIPVVTYTDNIPVTHKSFVKQALVAMRANAKNTNDDALEQTTTLMLSAIDDNIDWTISASSNALRLHSGNTEKINLRVPIQTTSGNVYKNTQAFDGKKVGERSIPDGRGNVINTEIYKVHDPKQPGSEKFVISYENSIVPNRNGGLYFDNVQDAQLYLNSKLYDATLPVDVNVNKVPSGRQITPEEISLLGTAMFGSNKNLIDE